MSISVASRKRKELSSSRAEVECSPAKRVATHHHRNDADDGDDDDKKSLTVACLPSSVDTGCMLSTMSPDVLSHITCPFLDDRGVACLSVANRSLYQSLAAVRTQRTIRKLATLRATLGTTMGVTVEETKSLWEAIGRDNGYWYGMELLYAFDSSSRQRRGSASMLVNIVCGDSVASWFKRSNFHKCHDTFYRGNVTVMISELPFEHPTFKLNARQHHVPSRQ